MTAPLIVAVVNSKGGPGKTTVAWNLANLWASASKRVLVVETDPQGTVLSFLAAREDKGSMEGAIIGLPQLAQSLPRKIASEAFDVVVIDTPGRLSDIAPAIRLADVIVCPVQASGADYLAFRRTFAAVEKEGREGRLLVVPNRVKTSGQEEELRATIPAAAKGKAKITAGSLGDWIAFSKNTLEGFCVLDVARTASKQVSALTSIAREIEEFAHAAP